MGCKCSNCREAEERKATERIDRYAEFVLKETPDANLRQVLPEPGWTLDEVWGLPSEADLARSAVAESVREVIAAIGEYCAFDGSFSCEHEPNGGCLLCYAAAQRIGVQEPLRLTSRGLWAAWPEELE